MSILAASLLLAAAAPDAAAAEPALIAGPIKMTKTEIRAYNAALASDDPAYIVCNKSAATGSMVVRTTCRTRGEWDRLAQIGNRDAVELADYAKTHQYSLSEEPKGSVMPGGN
ncbi:hypothetical protein ACOYW6_11300 [Parablastomonas sp. CN1-191]|uniref:hypothetical protein n=1 Tax=Parablastomonas sp. CN1-191 TaxID=3400908 RepID=UPI003BF916BF